MAHSIRVIGWSTICISIIILVSELVQISDTTTMDQYSTLFSAFPQARKEMDSLADLFAYNRLWSIYSIVYFSFVLIGAIQFVRFRKTGLLLLRIACWIGLANACLDSFISYIFMEHMNAALSSVSQMVGGGIGNHNTFGMAAILGGFILWIVPTIGMIFYLRRPKLVELMK